MEYDRTQNTYSDGKEAERIKTGTPNKPEEHTTIDASSKLSMKSK